MNIINGTCRNTFSHTFGEGRGNGFPALYEWPQGNGHIIMSVALPITHTLMRRYSFSNSDSYSNCCPCATPASAPASLNSAPRASLFLLLIQAREAVEGPAHFQPQRAGSSDGCKEPLRAVKGEAAQVRGGAAAGLTEAAQ
jgi:hypothetical protein